MPVPHAQQKLGAIAALVTSHQAATRSRHPHFHLDLLTS
jgi:hypothetical protein